LGWDDRLEISCFAVVVGYECSRPAYGFAFINSQSIIGVGGVVKGIIECKYAKEAPVSYHSSKLTTRSHTLVTNQPNVRHPPVKDVPNQTL
jgi:hypothetical protein